jgi:pyruvate kinase
MRVTILNESIREHFVKELPENFRYTKIIATLGPATESPEKLRELIAAGADVLRLNMAHATGQWVQQTVARIREVSTALNRQVAVMMDIKGPEIRTGDLPETVDLQPGDKVRFVCNGAASQASNLLEVPVNYPMLARDVKIGGVLIVDSGLLRLRAIEKDESSVLCEVINQAKLGSRRHINLPGVEVELPALTEKDIRDLRVGVDAGVDLIALSFVRRAADIHELKRMLMGLGSKAKIIAKIEEGTGVRNMREIILASDGIMVARGDLGIEIDYHRLPIIQRQLVEACLEEAKPVIIATQLLESMIEAPIPTRAEITDVSNAVREQADAVMLSGETTIGKHPVECVEVLKNIISSIQPTLTRRINERVVFAEPKTMMLRSAAVLSQELGNQGAGIVVFSRSGFLASMLGALRALGVPIFAFTDVETTYRQLVLPWGVKPFLIEFSDDPEVTILTALQRLRDHNFCVPGTWLVVVTHVLAADQVIETMQLRQF